MGIANYKPDINITPDKNIPSIQPSSYKSIVNDDNKIPLLSLLAYVTGSPWPVDYYSQYISKHNDLREIDTNQPGVYQQYQLIRNLELRVLSPLTDSYNSTTSLTDVVGTANFYPYVIPNINDYFITDVGDIEKGIFRITNVERKSFDNDSVYEIEYSLVGYVSSQQELYENLLDKTIKNYCFNKDRLLENLQPIVKEEEQQQINDLYVLYKDIVTYYFDNFVSAKYYTLVIPGQNDAIYDPFLTDYLFKLVDSRDSDKIKNLRSLSIDGDIFLKQPQLFSLLATKNLSGITTCNKYMGYISKINFNSNSTLRGVFFNYMKYFVYPSTIDVSNLIAELPLPKTLEEDYTLEPTTNSNGLIYNVTTDLYVSDLLTVPYIHPANKDDNYILSDAFYSNTEDKSVLEILVRDYLNNNIIKTDMLLGLCNRFRLWNRLDQFYYGPLILTLIKQSNKDTYT